MTAQFKQGGGPGGTQEPQKNKSEEGVMAPTVKESRKALTQKLRRIHNEVAGEPLPDKLRALIERLKEKRDGE